VHVSLMSRCARHRGALVGMLTALVSVAAVAPCLQVAAAGSHRSPASRSSSSHGTPPASTSTTATATTTSGSPAPPSAPGGPRDWLTSADKTLSTAVGVYSDCSGAAPVPQNMAAIDTCVKGRIYFVGHNAGVFTPLMHMAAGALITWYDGRGVAHVFRVVEVHDTAGAQPMTAPSQKSIVAQFQTCETPNGSVDRILDAASA
jgi:hypothetical protein